GLVRARDLRRASKRGDRVAIEQGDRRQDDHERRIPRCPRQAGSVRSEGARDRQALRRQAQLQVHRPVAAVQLRDHSAPARALGQRVAPMILFKLLALPLTAPMAGVRYCIEKVVEYAEHELNDEEPVREQLLELQIELEEGRVTEDEYTEREAVILARLREIRERRRELAREAAEASPPVE